MESQWNLIYDVNFLNFYPRVILFVIPRISRIHFSIRLITYITNRTNKNETKKILMNSIVKQSAESDDGYIKQFFGVILVAASLATINLNVVNWWNAPYRKRVGGREGGKIYNAIGLRDRAPLRAFFISQNVLFTHKIVIVRT